MSNLIERWGKAFPTTLILGSVMNMLSPGQVQAGGEIEWTNISNGLPNDIQIEALAIDPFHNDTIYATSKGGVHKTTDAGANWTTINNGLPVQTVPEPQSAPIAYTSYEELAIDPADSNNVYLGDTNGRIFKSSNKGSNWIEITNNLPLNPYPTENNIAVPKGGNGNTIYAGNWQGVFKSTDGGNTWNKINKPPLPTQIYGVNDVVLDKDDKLYVCLSYGGIYKSQDGGDSWVNLPIEWTNLDNLTIATSNTQIMYVSYYNGIYKSVNGGGSWTLTNTGLPPYSDISSIAIDPANPDIAYVTEYKSNTLYKTLNGGTNWGTVTLPVEAAAKKIVMANTTKYLYTAGVGVYKSTDNGSTWSFIINGLPHFIDIADIAADSKNTGTVYLINWHGAFKTTDYGSNWNAINTGLNVKYYPPGSREKQSQFNTIAVDPTNSNNIYIGGNIEFYKSNNSGSNWNVGTTGLSQWFNICSIAIDHQNSNIIYAVSSYDYTKIYKSIDGGTNWSTIQLNINNSISDLFIDPGSSTVIYGIGTWPKKLYRSDNSGQNWKELLSLPANSEVRNIAFGSNTLYACGHSRFYQETKGWIFKSNDRGETWTEISEKQINNLIIHPQHPFLLYALSTEGVVKSINEGKNWAEVNNGLPEIDFGAMGTGTIFESHFIMDKINPRIFYLDYSPLGLYRGTDTNSPPPPPTIHTPANNSKTSDNTPLIVGESQAGSLIYIYNGSNLLGNATADSNNQFIFTCGILTLGQHTLNFIAVDPFGTSNPTSIIINIVAGVIPTIDSPISGATNQATVTITGIAEDGSTVVIYDGFTPIATVTATNGFYSYKVKFGDGLHNLYVQSINNEGVIATSDMVNLLIDTQAPMPPIIIEPKYGMKIPDDILTIQGYTIPDSRVFIYINSEEIGSVTSDASTGKFTFITQILDDGKNEITAKVKDAVGNISPSSYPVVVTIGIPPSITNPVSGKTSKSTNIIISGKCRANASVGIYLDDKNIGTITASNSGTFSYTLTNLLNGTHKVKVNAVKGDKSGFSNIVTLIVDPDLPVDPIGVSISSPRGTEHPMSLDEDDKVSVHWQQEIKISVPVTGTPTRVYIKYNGTEADMSDNDHDGIYEYSFVPYPLHGNIPLDVVVEYATGTPSEVNIGSLLIDPDGHVYNAVTLGTVTDAVVTCYYFSTTTTSWVVWDAWNYPVKGVPQINPQTTTTTNDCYYSFLVPPGRYYVQAVCSGYKTYQSGVLEVINDPVHHDIYMEPIPVVTSITVLPQSVILGLGGTYSFTAFGYDQYSRAMGGVECNWSSTIGTVNPTTGIFTAPNTVTTGIITATTSTGISGTASVIVRQLTIIKLSPQTVCTRKNETFTINIDIDNVVDLLAAKVILSFDKNKIRVGTVSSSDFFLFSTVDNNQGVVEISGARLGTSSLTGSGTLYSVSFTSISADCSGTISITAVDLRDVKLSHISAGGNYPAVIHGRLLGDFGQTNSIETPDNIIDIGDLALFAKYWNIKELKGDIASTRTTGTAPNFTYEPDGTIDFEDLVYFAAMWNWDHQRGKCPVVSGEWKTSPTDHLPLTPAIVRLKTVKMDENEVCVDIVVENVTDFAAGHFILEYDTDKLDFATSIPQTPLSFVDEKQPGRLDINLADTDGKFRTGGSIARLTFHPKSQIPNPLSAISFILVELRETKQLNRNIPFYIVPIPTFASDLTGAYCYPNPYIPSQHSQEITFAGLTKETRIRIFDIVGELVYDSGIIPTTSPGTLNWRAVNQSGKPVTSGIYIYLITNNQGQKKTGKVGVIR